MRRAGEVVRRVKKKLREEIRPGVTTAELDRLAERGIRAQGAVPSFKGLYGFPATICASLNDEVVHGIPSGRVIRDGDIVSIDVGAIVDGFHADSAFTVAAGRVGKARPGPDRRHRGVPAARHRPGEGGSPRRGRVGGSTEVRRGAGIRRSAPIRGARHRQGSTRGPADPESRPSGQGRTPEEGHDDSDRADAEPRLVGDRGAGRRLDRGHRRRRVGRLTSRHTVAITGDGAEVLT